MSLSAVEARSYLANETLILHELERTLVKPASLTPELLADLLARLTDDSRQGLLLLFESCLYIKNLYIKRYGKSRPNQKVPTAFISGVLLWKASKAVEVTARRRRVRHGVRFERFRGFRGTSS